MRRDTNFRSIVAILATSALFACTQETIDSLPQTESKTDDIKELPRHRTYEEALAIAQDAIGLLGESSTTRSGKPRTVNTSEVQYILNTSATRSDDEPDTLMYVFNYEDNAGFAVVSANRATEELIAVTEQGHYIAGEETGNNGLDMYMNMAEAYVQSRELPPLEGGDDDGYEPALYETFIDRDTVACGPYLQVRWGQDWPYNRSCPIENGQPTKAGCVAIAIAQIMTYYQHPNSITITYAPTDYEQTMYWDYILEHQFTENKTSQTCSQCSIDNGHILLGSFIRQVGEEVKMIYHSEASGTESEFVKGAFQKFKYACGNLQTYSSSTVLSSLSNKKLVFMRGEVSDGEGHAWVVDGYRNITTVVCECMKPLSSLVWIEISRHTSTKTYHHINWGWDGNSNGYFLPEVFDVTSPSQLDPGMSILEEHYNFTVNLQIIPNISKQ